MNEKEILTKQKKQHFSLWVWAKNNPFIFILILFFLLFLLFNWLGKDNRKPFRFVKEENTGKILIGSLEEKDYRDINFDKKPKLTNYPFSKKYEYVFEGKNSKWWQKIFPTHYYALSELEPEEIEKTCLNEEGRLIIEREDKERPFELIVPEERSSFLTKRRVPDWVRQILISLAVVFIIDLMIGGPIMSRIFSRSRHRGVELADSPSIKFKDIGGLHEAKEELQEIIAYFRNPHVFWKHGAKIPKGVLLVGQPGNGKTLLAKALAGECKLPFIYRSAPEFEKGIVGWGAADVRNTFAIARKYAQEKGGCFIFVDEIDAIAGKRNHSLSSHHETLNQLLNELDGFSPRENVIFLAATNSLQSLDPALLRPGRFDRHILVPMPGYQARKEIITLCLTKKMLKINVDLEELVAITEGLSGAQIVNVFNEAVILSLRHNRSCIDEEIIFEAFDRTLMGPSSKSYKISPQKKLLIAYHEAGHALVGLSLPETKVKKITIVPRWSAGGYTWISLREQNDDSYLVNKNQILAQVTGLLGGRASEEMIYGRGYVTVGAQSDFKKASSLIRDLILRYGMSDLGIIFTQDSPFFGEENLQELSENSRQKIEKETEKILQQCYQRAQNILQEKRKVLDLLAKALVEKNTLQKEEIYYIFLNEKLPGQALLE